MLIKQHFKGKGTCSVHCAVELAEMKPFKIKAFSIYVYYVTI